MAMSTNFKLDQPQQSRQSPPPHMTPPVALILTVFVFIFFSACIFSICLCRYFMEYLIDSWNLRATPASGNAVQQTGSGTNGLDPSIIDTFPTLVYSSVKDLRQDKGDLECAVCLVEFKDNDELRLLTVCNHVFHPDCIDPWFGNHTTCPLCRSSLLPPEKSPENNVITTSPENDQQERETREENNSESTKDEEEEHGEVMVVVVDGGGDSHEGTTTGAMATQDGGQQGEEVVVERFSRSHSTGHSIIHVEPELNHDRYTLRLPDHVKENIIKGHNLTKSCTTFGEFSHNAGSRKAGLAELSGLPGGDVNKV